MVLLILGTDSVVFWFGLTRVFELKTGVVVWIDLRFWAENEGW